MVEGIMKFVILVSITFAISLIGAWFTEYFVNYLFTPTLLLTIFGIGKITFWQGFVLNLLVGGLKSSGSSSSSKD